MKIQMKHKSNPLSQYPISHAELFTGIVVGSDPACFLWVNDKDFPPTAFKLSAAGAHIFVEALVDGIFARGEKCDLAMKTRIDSAVVTFGDYEFSAIDDSLL